MIFDDIEKQKKKIKWERIEKLINFLNNVNLNIIKKPKLTNNDILKLLFFVFDRSMFDIVENINDTIIIYYKQSNSGTNKIQPLTQIIIF